MLREITIENLAVIEHAHIPFGDKLNVLTGETGAGKSILIGGINAVLGQRMNKEIVRTGAQKAIVAALFSSLPRAAKEKLSEYGFDPNDDELILQREISADGGSTVRINGRVSTNAILRDISQALINIHGQHDNQILLSPERHLAILDSFGNLEGALAEYRDSFRHLQAIAREINRLSVSAAERAQRLDLLTYQIGEIESADLGENEDVQLEAERKVIRNAAKLLDGLNSAYAGLSGVEELTGAVELVGDAAAAVEEIADTMEGLGELQARLSSAAIELDDIKQELSDYIDSIEADPKRLGFIEERLSDIHSLQRKYGGTIADILEHLEKCRNELEQMEASDTMLEDLQQQKREALRIVKQQAEAISTQREQAAQRFISLVTAELSYLNMPNVRLAVQSERGKLTVNGLDTVEFLISANEGEPPKPISKIASGGELSRIMLALKSVLADKDDIPTLIFDEIDTGVSGRAAQKIGSKLAEIAQHRQVLCVTHLAQIAIMASDHLLIEKNAKDGRTFTQVLPLDFEARKHEIARIMGGDNVTELLLQNAEELLKSASVKQ